MYIYLHVQICIAQIKILPKERNLCSYNVLKKILGPSMSGKVFAEQAFF